MVQKDTVTGSNGHSRRRQEILKAATVVFEAHGYGQTTVDAVAAEAKISKGSIYNYFPSKHDLFFEVFREAVQPDEQYVEDLIARDIPATDKLCLYVDHWFANIERYKSIGGLFLEFWANIARDQNRGDLTANFLELDAGWREQLARIVTQGQASGEFVFAGTVESMAMFVNATLDGITLHAIIDAGPELDPSVPETIKRGLLANLSAGNPIQTK